MKHDPLKPTPGLLVKLGSLVIHMEEAQSSDGHAFDAIAIQQLQNDPEVKDWFKGMHGMAMLPVKRRKQVSP